MEEPPCVFLGFKIKPGPIERHKVEYFPLDNTVDLLKYMAEKQSNIPSASLELIHHGKVLKDSLTLQECGIKSGETVHVLKKKEQPASSPPPTYTDAELQQIAFSLRTLGCTPNAPGWTRAMQLLNDESVIAEIMEQAPSLSEDCVTMSILHEVELLAALGYNIHTMRRGANAYPDLPTALRHLTQLVRSRSVVASSSDHVPTSGFAYSLEALSEDEDADEEETEDGERNTITQEQLAAALQAATEAVSISVAGTGDTPRPSNSESSTVSGPGRSLITSEMFNAAISEAINRASGRNNAGTPMDQSVAGSSSHSPTATSNDFVTQLQHMNEMGLVDDALNLRALLICSGDVNAAINLVFSGAIGDD